MHLWFTRSKDVTLREQLVTQVILGILSDDMCPGTRLPSTRELARRFRLHANTVSAAYRELEKLGWVEHRHGSGVFVSSAKPQQSASHSIALDRLITDLFRAARSLGVPSEMLRSRLLHWLDLQPPNRLVLVEPDRELARIVASEMQYVLKMPVEASEMNHFRNSQLDGAVPVVLPTRARLVEPSLPEGMELIVLQIRSVPGALRTWLPAPSGALVGIASRWLGFLKMARAMLIAAGFSPEALVIRDARKPHWQRGLKETAAVVCDSLIASDLPKGCRAISFPLLAEASLAELRRYEESLRTPLTPAV